MADSPMRWVWVDLEMTGLDTERCAIIEMAMIITDDKLNPLCEFERVVWQSERVLGDMSPFVRAMHEKNGLLPKVRASATDTEDVQREAVAMLLRHCGYREGVLAGNSIHTDRRFLARYMPLFEGLLHYRQIDVSSLKVLAQAWSPSALQAKSSKSHTALEDIRGSIAELTHYRRELFHLPE